MSDEYEFAKDSVERMVWLDCGHSGDAKGTFVNDVGVLETLVQLEIKVDVRATPYQGRSCSVLLLSALATAKRVGKSFPVQEIQNEICVRRLPDILYIMSKKNSYLLTPSPLLHSELN